MRAAAPAGFYKEGTAAVVLRTLCKTYVWADSLVPVYPGKWRQDARQGSKKVWPAGMNLSWLCKNLWLLVRMCLCLGKVPGKHCAGCPLLGNSHAERVQAPGHGSLEALSLFPWEHPMLPCPPGFAFSCPLALLAAGTGPALTPCLPGPSPAANGEVPVCSVRQCLSKAFITCLHNSAWNYWGKKNTPTLL